MDEETTMRVFKREALIMRQMQSLMDMHNRRMTQAELIHSMFDFIADRQNEFFKEIEAHRKMNDRLMDEWTKIIFQRMKQK